MPHRGKYIHLAKLLDYFLKANKREEQDKIKSVIITMAEKRYMGMMAGENRIKTKL